MKLKKLNKFLYTFGPNASTEGIQTLIMLATIAVEGLFGEGIVLKNPNCWFNPSKKICFFNAEDSVGRVIMLIFGSFLKHEESLSDFKLEQFAVEELDD